MHSRIHPFFADSFLESLGTLPPSDPMNDLHLTTRLEVVLTRDGHIQQIGVVRSSEVTAFDIAALDSLDRAQPYGPVPDAIVSFDGFAYLHWEFRRDVVYACSPMGARPFRLASPQP
jgi:TonB family protein